MWFNGISTLVGYSMFLSLCVCVGGVLDFTNSYFSSV